MNIRRVAWALGLLFLLTGCDALFQQMEKPEGRDDHPALDVLNPLEVPADPALSQHSDEFRREIIQVTDRVYVAVGYALANSILIVGEGGNIVVDATESPEVARALRVEFDRIAPAPLAGLIYTHNHGDHTFGAGGMVGSDQPEVLGHEDTEALVRRVVGMLNPTLSRRAARMFGSSLNGPAFENAGIGPELKLSPNRDIQFLPPTQTVSDRLEVTIAGVRMLLVHAPGETDDQIYVYLPDDGVLLPGDNFYRAFPNLYTIRGTPYRSLEGWTASLDAMIAHKPEHLVPSHTRPISGAEQIAEALTQYRDAIQFVHDQAVRAINSGASPDSLLELELPETLAESPYLQSFYGRPGWSARAVYSGYLGWFNGNPTGLDPLGEAERAENWVRMAGGVDALVTEAMRAWSKAEYRWILHISDAVLQVAPEHQTMKTLRSNALVRLGAASSNPNQRHYYLVAAQQMNSPGAGVLPPNEALLERIPMEDLLRILRVRLDPEKAAGVDVTVRLEFDDGGVFDMQVRNSVLVVHSEKKLRSPDVVVKGSRRDIKLVLGGVKNVIAATTISGELTIERGSRVSLLNFLTLFASGS
ncbi:MAG: MBL fold metallo-hydrolase [Gammaproteobacteria bacterium AqS3]|nr:MBL fold metallo-hydrolase [Gammaproteobacteria bacterium AqS3]